MLHNKNLIVYYSRTGNTQEIANMIKKIVGGKLVRIETITSRPTDYQEEVKQNYFEQQHNILPKIKVDVKSLDEYTNIYIGTPTWNMALPQAVVTFLQSYDFNGKEIYPFNTNAGFGMGKIVTQISEKTNGSKVYLPFSKRGGEEHKGIVSNINDNNRTEISLELK